MKNEKKNHFFLCTILKSFFVFVFLYFFFLCSLLFGARKKSTAALIAKLMDGGSLIAAKTACLRLIGRFKPILAEISYESLMHLLVLMIARAKDTTMQTATNSLERCTEEEHASAHFLILCISSSPS